MTNTQTYQEKKEHLSSVFRQRSGQGNLALQKENSNLFRSRQQSKDTARIDVRDFKHVIKIDAGRGYADVEGMTTYEDLVRETLNYGLMPAVVPELKSITVGGAVTGIGIEATSFAYGLVHETVTELDVILAYGTVVLCTPDNEHSDLFFGFPNSYGTLGYALRVRVKLVPVKKYVKIKRLFYNNAEIYFQDLEKFSLEKKHDFVDGVIFSPEKMYINAAVFADEAPFVSDYTYLKIYYHSFKEKEVDYLSVADYIWRWDTDWFWCSKNFGLEHKLARLLLGRRRLNSKFYNKLRHLNQKLAWVLKPKLTDYWHTLRRALRRSPVEAVIQDVEIPAANAQAFLEFFQRSIGITPVWVCPTKVYNPNVNFSLYPMDARTLYVNFGFWDYVPSKREPGYYNRLIEKKVMELGGKKSLYADSYYDEETFWRLYNRPAYAALKAKYDPRGRLLNLYDKCVRRR